VVLAGYLSLDLSSCSLSLSILKGKIWADDTAYKGEFAKIPGE
jgi:hypothetical protein